jgi:hypothetical protein
LVKSITSWRREEEALSWEEPMQIMLESLSSVCLLLRPLVEFISIIRPVLFLLFEEVLGCQRQRKYKICSRKSKGVAMKKKTDKIEYILTFTEQTNKQRRHGMTKQMGTFGK